MIPDGKKHLDPALHVIAGSLGRGHRGAQLSSRDHRRSAFLRVGFVHLSLFFQNIGGL